MMKKIVTLLFVCILSACTTFDPGLQNAIAYGSITEVNDSTNDMNKELLVRLYQSPIENNDCYIETEGVCQYQFFLSVSTFDEKPETAIYPLNFTGEVQNIEWIESQAVDVAVLDFTVQTYTSNAVMINSNLEQSSRILRIKVSPHSIEEVSNKI